jgi:hypothetical protein
MFGGQKGMPEIDNCIRNRGGRQRGERTKQAEADGTDRAAVSLWRWRFECMVRAQNGDGRVGTARHADVVCRV